MTSETRSALTPAGRYAVLAVGFLGWLFAGVHMSITQMTGQPAAMDLLDRTGQINAIGLQDMYKRLKNLDGASPLTAEELANHDLWKPKVAQWFVWFQCAFLFGAATGGFCFGWLGDRMGRAKAMGASILMYSVMAAATALTQSPFQFWIAWFLACTGVGGMWPNGVALIAEAWSGLSRPAMAGVIGTAANIGIFGMSTIGTQIAITPDSWRWVMFVGASPVLLGIIAIYFVPESPRWLASRTIETTLTAKPRIASELFRRPMLSITLVAILLGTVPMIGGWGTANWMNPWADETGNPLLKAQVGQARSMTGIVGSLLGGWIASQLGRKATYFLVSLGSLLLAQFIFWFVVPTDRYFLVWVAILGFVSGIYFGWLPLCMPEFFPTRVRAAGAGIGFNSGRIVTAVTLFIGGGLIEFFDGDYARIGRATSLIFVLGIVGIWFAPNVNEEQIGD